MTTWTIPTRQRIEWLDSIRGLAALAVLLNHSIMMLNGPASFKRVMNLPLLSIAHDDRTAVTMFFLLSGFVLVLPYVTERDDGQFRPAKLWSFYARRLTRIWIPWFAVFCLSLAAKEWLAKDWTIIPSKSAWGSQFWKGDLTMVAIVRQMFFLLDDWSLLMLPQDWSLRVELIGSALMPLFVWLAVRNGWLLAALASLLLLHRTGFYYWSFAMGTLLARYGPVLAKWFQGLSGGGKVLLLSLGLVLHNVRFWKPPGMELKSEWPIWCVAAMGCGIILISALGSARIKEWLSRPLLVFIGRISYSLYLVQFVVLLGLLPGCLVLLNRLGMNNPIAGYFFFSLTFTLAVTVLLSMLCYQWVEAPSMDLGKRLSRRLEEPTAGRGETKK